MTIGYLFDEVNHKFFSDDTKQKFVSCIIFNLDKSSTSENLKIAMNSFLKILPAIKFYFNIREFKAQIMQKIYELKDEENCYDDLLLVLYEIAKNNFIDLDENDMNIIIEISEKCVRRNIEIYNIKK